MLSFALFGCENKEFYSVNNYDVINEDEKFDKILLSDTSVESLINIIKKSYFRSVSRDVLYILTI